MSVAQAVDELAAHHHYVAQLQLNSSGESSRGTNSPATSDFGHDFDGGGPPASLLSSASRSLSHSPREDTSSRFRAASPDAAYQLQPLAEMEVIGACRRGRRRGRRNRTAAEREAEVSQRRLSKNARERQRVENVKSEYARLQKLLGLTDQMENEPKERRRHCKLRTLTTAIERIRTLMAELQLRRANISEEAPAQADPTHRPGHSGRAAAGQLSGSCDSASCYWQCCQHPDCLDSSSLSCSESSGEQNNQGRDSNLPHSHSPTLAHPQPVGCPQSQNLQTLSSPFHSVPPFLSGYSTELPPAMGTLYQPNSGCSFPNISSSPYPPNQSGAHPSVTALNPPPPPPPPFAHSSSDAFPCYSPTVDSMTAAWTQSLPSFSTFIPYDLYPTYSSEDGSFYPPPPPPPPLPCAFTTTTSVPTWSY